MEGSSLANSKILVLFGDLHKTFLVGEVMIKIITIESIAIQI